MKDKICGVITVFVLLVFVSLQASDIRRLNNMMSDHGVHTRPRLLVPIPPSKRPSLLPGRPFSVHFDPYARREVVLVGERPGEGSSVSGSDTNDARG